MPSLHQLRVYKAAINEFGPRAQILKAAEEMSECAAAICKMLNDKPENLAAVIEELADVETMCEQMRLVFDPVIIDQVKASKLRRLEKTLQTIKKRKA